MRIIIAGQTYYPEANGQAVFTTNLAEGLVRQGHEVMVILPSERFKSYQIRHEGVRIEKVSAFPLSPTHTDIHITPFPRWRVHHLFRTFQPHLVHIQDHYPLSRSVLQAAERNGLPVMGTNHFLPENLLRNLPVPPWGEKAAQYILWQTMLLAYNRLDVITTPTETAANILRQQAIRVPVHPISCGVDTERFFPDQSVNREAMRRKYGLFPRRALFLYVGRLDHEKRLDVMLDALHILRRDDLQLAIAGRGLHQKALRAKAKALALGENVRFLGYVPAGDLPGLLNSADIFVMPSEAELQSIATLEAMASGLPILAANARALPELVDDGVNGYLFQSNHAEDAARRIRQLMQERQRWQSMGMASLEKVSAHSIENSVQKYETLYHTVVRLHLSGYRQAKASPRPKKINNVY